MVGAIDRHTCARRGRPGASLRCRASDEEMGLCGRRVAHGDTPTSTEGSSSGRQRDPSRSGGTGRRTGLKIRRSKGRGGSIPPFGIPHVHLIIRRAPGIQSAARVVAAGVVVGGLALVVAGCGSSEAAACGGVEYAGTGAPDLVLVSSLPLRGPSSAVSLQINDAIRAQLKTRRFEAGRHTIGFQACDDSTAAAGGSDPGRCAENAERVCGRGQRQGYRSDRPARFAVRRDTHSRR